MCYLYCSERKVENDTEAIKLCIDAWQKGILDDDGTVKSAYDLLKFFDGKRYNVTKKDIIAIEDIKEKTPVRFNNGKFQHWVVIENGRIVFNPLEISYCVKNGIPTTARIIKQIKE